MRYPVAAVLTLGLLVALLLASGVEAESTHPFQRVGKITRLNAHRHVIVVDDAPYRLPTSVRVYHYNRRAQRSDGEYKGRPLGNGKVLRRGMTIGFNVEGEGPGRPGRIVEAWILPPHSIRASTE